MEDTMVDKITIKNKGTAQECVEIEETKVSARTIKMSEIDAILASLEEQKAYWTNVKNLAV